eukprot:TRINITY_DN33923_c0_g1_i1.p2 TRINITY_DN33923_c0_g1~~TRINITY_DN33923_c0_g1_i1.p2  ORF type:complete len:150 (+),score=26.45 TRINITY_DN33923_c0_g1_i1:58-450(+)
MATDGPTTSKAAEPQPILRGGASATARHALGEGVALSTTPGGTVYGTTPGGTRFVYKRADLLHLRESPLSHTPPDLPSLPGLKQPLSGVSEVEDGTSSSGGSPQASPPCHQGAIHAVPGSSDPHVFQMDE